MVTQLEPPTGEATGTREPDGPRHRRACDGTFEYPWARGCCSHAPRLDTSGNLIPRRSSPCKKARGSWPLRSPGRASAGWGKRPLSHLGDQPGASVCRALSARAGDRAGAPPIPRVCPQNPEKKRVGREGNTSRSHDCAGGILSQVVHRLPRRSRTTTHTVPARGSTARVVLSLCRVPVSAPSRLHVARRLIGQTFATERACAPGFTQGVGRRLSASSFAGRPRVQRDRRCLVTMVSVVGSCGLR